MPLATTIKVIRNDSGNCVHFVGSSLPTYWNGCLSAEIDAKNPYKINIRNNVSSTEGRPVYEFYGIHFKRFRSHEDVGFNSPEECAEYITAAANVSIGDEEALFPPPVPNTNPGEIPNGNHEDVYNPDDVHTPYTEDPTIPLDIPGDKP